MELPEPLSFQWDRGNISKNFTLHGVTNEEIEEVFWDPRKKLFRDHLHSGNEERFRLIGKTKAGRLLFVVIVIRRETVRVISARDLNKKEVPLYEEKS